MDLHIQKSFGKITTTAGEPEVRHGLFEVVLLLVIIGLFYWFMVVPKKADLAAASGSLSELQDQQKNLNENKRKLLNLIDSLKSHSKEVAQMDEALPLENKPTDLQLVLENMIQSSGMTVSSNDIAYQADGVIAGDKAMLQDPYKPARKIKKQDANLHVIGTVEQFQELLKKVETNGRLMDIKSIEIRSTKDGQLDFNLQLEAYNYAP